MKTLKFVSYRKQMLKPGMITLALLIFSLFIRCQAPWNAVAVIFLLLSVFLVSREIDSFKDARELFGLNTGRSFIMQLFIGFVLGLLLAFIYRQSLGIKLIPETFTQFALVGATIGGVEELIFRGYLQGKTTKIHKAFGVTYAALSHSLYKCCLFLLPLFSTEINLLNLFLLTFGVGILLGILKETSRSIYPPMLAHMLFDILIYGAFASAPWWVW